jgi:hypothetical protein
LQGEKEERISSLLFWPRPKWTLEWRNRFNNELKNKLE